MVLEGYTDSVALRLTKALEIQEVVASSHCPSASVCWMQPPEGAWSLWPNPPSANRKIDCMQLCHLVQAAVSVVWTWA